MLKYEADYKIVADVIAKRLDNRGISDFDVELCGDLSLSDGAYRIENDRVYASDLSGMFSGAGRYLRETLSSGSKITGKIECVPECEVRGVYFASHFHNFYHVAPLEELYEYLDDLALYGINAIMAIVPTIDLSSIDDPEKEKNIERLSKIFKHAHKNGMKTCTCFLLNSGYKDYPRKFEKTPVNDALGRRGNSGNMMCVASEEARKLIDLYNADIFELFKKYDLPLDFMISWPYDEGGCGCEKCAPWGAKGFIEMSKREYQLGLKYYPEAKLILSTWMYDTPYEGEWEALTESLSKEKWCDYIMADAHEKYPAYPLEHGVPGGLPLITFPEISMWGLYPWGGFGATPLPERFTKLWQEHPHKFSGGFCYSEGIYEDINKAIIAGLYIKGDADFRGTLAEYAGYEFGITDPAMFIKLCELIERNHTTRAVKNTVSADLAEDAYYTALKLDSTIPDWAKKCWRWRIILLRARIEYYRCFYPSKEELQKIPEVMAAFRELVNIFHCSEHVDDDPYHGRVRPWAD